MKTQSIDTSPDAERVLIEMIRKAPVAKRFSFVQSWSHSLIEGGRINIQQLHPQATEQEVLYLYAERLYGRDVVAEVRAALQERGLQPSSAPDFLAALNPFLEALKCLHVPYALGGSLASSLYGMQRATLQLDLFAALGSQHGTALREQIALKYFFREHEVQIALEQKTPFTLIHLESLLKVVVSLLKPWVFDQEMLGRAHSLVLVGGDCSFPVLSPEDMVMLQLEQFKSSGQRADDIWYDLLGLLKVQGPTIDLMVLEKQAAVLDVIPLLRRALVDAGLKET